MSYSSARFRHATDWWNLFLRTYLGHLWYSPCGRMSYRVRYDPGIIQDSEDFKDSAAKLPGDVKKRWKFHSAKCRSSRTRGIDNAFLTLSCSSSRLRGNYHRYWYSKSILQENPILYYTYSVKINIIVDDCNLFIARYYIRAPLSTFIYSYNIHQVKIKK